MTAEEKTKTEEKTKEEKESQAKAGKVQKVEVKKEAKPEEEAKKSEAEGQKKETEETKAQIEEPKKAEVEKEAGAEVEAGGLKVELTEKAKDVVKTIESMTVLELSNLVKALEEKFGVVAAPAMMVPQTIGAPAGAGAEPPAEEKTTFDVILSSIGDKKIQVIKEVRAITNLGLKEAKDLVDRAPKPVREGIPNEEAEEIKKKLEAVGATVEVK